MITAVFVGVTAVVLLLASAHQGRRARTNQQAKEQQ